MKKLLAFASLFLTCLSLQAQVKKSVSILGDSYSTFNGYLVPDTNYVWYPAEKRSTNDVTDVRQTWWHRFIRENGFRLCINNSFSGATICYTGYNKEDYSDRSFCTRLKYLGNPDIILVFGATNDSWAKSPIGEFKYAGWTHGDLYKFRPAMAYMLSQLIDRYPGVDLYFIINDILSSEVTESAKAICDHYGVKYIMLHDIDKQSGHPSVKGMEQIADQLRDVVK